MNNEPGDDRRWPYSIDTTDLDLHFWRRVDLCLLARDAGRGARALWAAEDRELELEALALVTRRGDPRLYFGAAPELRTAAVMPSWPSDRLDRPAREAVFSALDESERRGFDVHAFASRARPLPPVRRADLLALYTTAQAEASLLRDAPPALVCAFTLRALDIEAVCVRNAAGAAVVRFAHCPPLRWVSLARWPTNEPREELGRLRALVMTEQAVGGPLARRLAA